MPKQPKTGQNPEAGSQLLPLANKLIEGVENHEQWAKLFVDWRPGFYSSRLNAVIFTHRHSSWVLLAMFDGCALCTVPQKHDAEFQPWLVGESTPDGVVGLMLQA